MSRGDGSRKSAARKRAVKANRELHEKRAHAIGACLLVANPGVSTMHTADDRLAFALDALEQWHDARAEDVAATEKLNDLGESL